MIFNLPDYNLSEHQLQRAIQDERFCIACYSYSDDKITLGVAQAAGVDSPILFQEVFLSGLISQLFHTVARRFRSGELPTPKTYAQRYPEIFGVAALPLMSSTLQNEKPYTLKFSELDSPGCFSKHLEIKNPSFTEDDVLFFLDSPDFVTLLMECMNSKITVLNY